MSTGDFEEASVKRALHDCAAGTIVMASPEKLGAASPYVICRVEEIAVLLVPKATTPEVLKDFLDLGVSVKRAE